MTKPVIILEGNSPPIFHLETLFATNSFQRFLVDFQLPTPYDCSYWFGYPSIPVAHTCNLWPVSIKLPSQCCISKAISLRDSCYLVLDFYAYPLLIKINAKSICSLIDPCQYIQGIEPQEFFLYIISLNLCSLIVPKEIYSTSWKKSKQLIFWHNIWTTRSLLSLGQWLRSRKTLHFTKCPPPPCIPFALFLLMVVKACITLTVYASLQKIRPIMLENDELIHHSYIYWTIDCSGQYWVERLLFYSFLGSKCFMNWDSFYPPQYKPGGLNLPTWLNPFCCGWTCLLRQSMSFASSLRLETARFITSRRIKRYKFTEL